MMVRKLKINQVRIKWILDAETNALTQVTQDFDLSGSAPEQGPRGWHVTKDVRCARVHYCLFCPHYLHACIIGQLL
jgi:hypothetical protein